MRALAFAATLVASLACTGSVAAAEPSSLVVFAAASLQDAFVAIGEAFERSRPGMRVTFSFAGTQQLRAQLEHGAAADVFAAADAEHMEELRRASRVLEPVVFARNEPVVVVADESAGKIRSLADLPSGKRLVFGAPEVPIGRYTIAILDRASAGALGSGFRARVEKQVVSHELNVRQVLAKVRLGEADAGIVYRTDVRTLGDGIGVVTIPLDVNVIAEYPIAIVTGARNPELARSWIDFVLSSEARAILDRAGFIAPTGGTKRE